MRLIGELNDGQQARLFSAFLLVKGIESQIDLVDSAKAEVWVKDEDRFQEASEELEKFVANPADAKYSDAVQQALPAWIPPFTPSKRSSTVVGHTPSARKPSLKSHTILIVEVGWSGAVFF